MPPTPPSTSPHAISGTTRIFGVIADPISHVQAPAVFNPLFIKNQLDAVMVPIHIRPSDLSQVLPALARLPNMGGVAVTIPHKMAAAGLCQTLGVAAEATSAVNAIRFADDGNMHGDNFDGAGFVAGLMGEGRGHALAGKHVLLLGAGGAARGIALALAEFANKNTHGDSPTTTPTKTKPIASLHIANRSRERGEALVTLINQHYPALPVVASGLNVNDQDKSKFGLIINATSLGLKDTDPLPMSLKGVAKSCIIADIIMQPETTPWLTHAHTLALTTHEGKFMLAYQRDLIGKFLGIL